MHENPRSNFQTHATGKTVVDSVNIETAGITLSLFQDVWLIESSPISNSKHRGFITAASLLLQTA